MRNWWREFVERGTIGGKEEGFPSGERGFAVGEQSGVTRSLKRGSLSSGIDGEW